MSIQDVNTRRLLSKIQDDLVSLTEPYKYELTAEKTIENYLQTLNTSTGLKTSCTIDFNTDGICVTLQPQIAINYISIVISVGSSCYYDYDTFI